MLLAVCYDANGRMTHAQALRNADVLALQKDSAKILLFLLDENGKPVCMKTAVKGAAE